MRHLGRRPRVLVIIAALAGFGACAGAGCSRTGLGGPLGDELPPGDAGHVPQGEVASPPASAPVSHGNPASHEKPCVPAPETCNGVDDDCNGQVDDGIASIPCPGGGRQYCVAGRLSACPTRCDACLPGSERVCFHAYCTYWAIQSCAADGKSFGLCREREVPPECANVASAHQESPELERCCIDNGYCCHDEFDLDGDGDRGEMLGTCDEVSCGP